MKKIVPFVRKNRLFMIISFVLVIVTGYSSYTKLPIDAFPDVSPSLVQVFTTTEGLAPEEVEKYITFPIEVSMNGLPNLKKISSVSNFGLSVVNIYFEDGTDIYFARQLVSERVQEAREQIPEGFGEPQMGPISTGMGLILFYYLDDESGKYSLEELRTIQDWLVKYQLQTVPGVTEVLGIGGWEKQFHVNINPSALLRYDVTINEVVKKIKENNLNVGASFIEKEAEEFLVRSIGLASKIDDLKNIIIKSNDGVPLYLKKLANIKIGGAVRRGVQTRNGISEVIAGQVVKLYGTNSSTVIGEVDKKIKEINKILPQGIKLIPYYEQKTLVVGAVKTVTDALWQGVILVTFVLMFFMGSFRPSLVVALSIPFSIIFAFIGMYYMDISVNLMSFGGLAIAIGMMVDASIVLVENIDRLIRESEKSETLVQIIVQACNEVIRPILFSVIIIITVFIPLFSLQGVEGKTFKPLAFTFCLAMFGSLIFALFLAPAFSSFLMKQDKGKENHEVWIVKKLTNIYVPIVTFFVKNRIYAIMLAVGILLTGIIIFPSLGSEFTPKLQEGSIVVHLQLAPSIALTETTRITLLVEKRLMDIPGVTDVVTRIGRGEVGAHTCPINTAEMYVSLKQKNGSSNGANQKEIEQLIRDKLKGIPGVQSTLTQPIQMTVDELLEGVKAELAVKLFGDDLSVLKENAEKIAGIIRQVPGAADIQVDQISGKPQLKIQVNRHAIARYGINISNVQEVIRTAIGGENAGQIFEGIRRFNIFVRFEKVFRNTPEAIKGLIIKSPSGINIPLIQLAEVKEVEGPRQIKREQNQRFITIQCNVLKRDIVSFVGDAQKAIDEKIDLPAGYRTTWGGQFRLQQEANKRFAIVIPITFLLIFILLFSNFNSFKNSFLILLNIPLSLVGGVMALWLTGQNLSVPSSVGFIALFGIALENAMILVTYFNQLSKDGLEIDEVAIKGAILRLRPVVMTAVTTSLGLIPLLISSGVGSDVQRPLATVVVGGLFTSTILTLILLPALYKWFSNDNEMNSKY